MCPWCVYDLPGIKSRNSAAGDYRNRIYYNSCGIPGHQKQQITCPGLTPFISTYYGLNKIFTFHSDYLYYFFIVKKHLIPNILFLFLYITAHSQDISGFWKGTLSMQGCFIENNIELQLKMYGNSAMGDSYHYQNVDNYVKKKVRGLYDPDTKKLSVQEGLVSTYHIPGRCVICVKKFDLVYKREGNIETFSGYWSGYVLGSSISCDGGTIILTRIAESAFKEIPEVKVDTGTIRLDFYDNAVVDGDSITILVNKKVILTHQRLSSVPITTYLKIDLSNTFHEVEMVAENLGSIPPNTAILIITAGNNRYQLALSSTDNKSARIRIVYDPDLNHEKQTLAAVHGETISSDQ